MPLEEKIVQQITSNSITTLYLGDNEIGEDGAKDLAKALKINKSITNLNLLRNKIGDAGMRDLAKALKNNRSITKLTLTDNQIEDDGVQALAEALKVNYSITYLELRYNKIGDDGVQALAKTLKINHSLTTLDLYNSQIGDAGAQAIAEALKDNHSITTLYLHTNQIGDAGAQAVAEALKVNYTINYLHIRSNQIGDAGAQAIAEALKVNKSITSFYIDRGNPIGSVGVKYLADALKINKSIVTFGTAFNNIGNIVKKEIETALQINNELAAKTKQETLAKQAAEQARQKEAERLEKEAKLREQEAAEQARQEALAKQIAEQTRQKEAERLEKEAKLREQEAAEQARQEALVKKYIAEQVRQQEAERVKQQAKLREQEEAKAAKEAAELKAIEEAKIKEYIPNIPAVKLFEVAGRDNQFDNDDQATIQQVSDLMRDGNDHLQENVKKAVLVVGKTGAGKSTLVHVLSGNELQAIRDDATSELVIDAIQPLSDIVIGHKMSSETKIPNKCLAKDLTIWDCPGFNDTDLVQEIANIFYIKRLFEITDQLKFVLVVDESDLRSNRGSDFLETLSNFIKSFKDIKSIEGGSIFLVVTHVPPNKNIQNIQKSIDNILTYNQGATKKCKELISKLKDGNSIHLFYKPTEEGELTVPDLLAEIDKSSTYSDANSEMVDIAISKKAMECSSHLLNTASNNFNQLLEVIVKAIADATNCLNVNPLNAFSENYAIVKDLVPSSINYNELKQHSEGEYFPELELLSRLQKVLNYNQIDKIPDALMIFQIAVELFAEYADFDNSQLQHQIQDYGYCLQQQYEYVKFFANVCGANLPDHAKIAELITACHAKVTENLEYQVSSLNIDENQSDPEYYHKAIKYLENYQDSPACKNLKAIAYSCLASIAEHDGANESALAYYAKAIDANSHLPKIYEELGQLFFNKGEYAKAIDCYKVVNNEFKIKACFKAWLKQDQENPDIMLKQAEYFESIGLFEKAKTYYHHAFSLSHDKNFKVAAYNKIANIMLNAAAQGQDFATKAQEQDFYNYYLVDEEFTKNLLGEVVCDIN